MSIRIKPVVSTAGFLFIFGCRFETRFIVQTCCFYSGFFIYIWGVTF